MLNLLHPAVSAQARVTSVAKAGPKSYSYSACCLMVGIITFACRSTEACVRETVKTFNHADGFVTHSPCHLVWCWSLVVGRLDSSLPAMRAYADFCSRGRPTWIAVSPPRRQRFDDPVVPPRSVAYAHFEIRDCLVASRNHILSSVPSSVKLAQSLKSATRNALILAQGSKA